MKKTISMITICAALVGCEKNAPAEADAMAPLRAGNELIAAAKEEVIARDNARRDESEVAQTELQISAERLDKATARAREVGMEDLEIRLRIQKGATEGRETVKQRAAESH